MTEERLLFFLLSKSEIKKRIFDRVTDGVTEEKLQDGFPRSKPKKVILDDCVTEAVTAEELREG